MMTTQDVPPSSTNSHRRMPSFSIKESRPGQEDKISASIPTWKISNPVKPINNGFHSILTPGVDKSIYKSRFCILNTEQTNQYKEYLESFQGTVPEIRNFVYQHLPKTEGIVQVKIYVVKSGFLSYTFELRSFRKGTLLMTSNRKVALTPYYVFNLTNSKYSRDSNQFIGKVRGNLYKNKYYLYDNGAKPSKSKTPESNRNEYLAVQFRQIEFSKNSSIRTLHVVLPKDKDDIKKCCNDDDEVLLDPFVKGNISKLCVFRNKSAKYDKADQQYKIALGGKTISSKDCIVLLDSQMNSSNAYYMIEKVRFHEYNCFFKAPFSLFQAFGLAIICIVSKWNVI
jgi:hypothetical protein